MGNKVALLGLGDIGGYALELLAREPSVTEIVTADVDEDRGRFKCQIALASAFQGHYKDISFHKLDLFNVADTVAFFRREKPDIVLSTASLLPPWAVEEPLPDSAVAELDGAGYGPWLPMHLALIRNVMLALRKAELKIPVVNSSFPDVVNAVLGREGMAPAAGVGNSDQFVPLLQKVVGEELGVPRRNVAIYLVAPHYIWRNMNYYKKITGARYFLKVLVGDKDVTRSFNTDDLLERSVSFYPNIRPTARDPHPIGWLAPQVSASAVKNVMGILNNTGELTHTPGPEGLPGGYPVRLTSEGAKVVLPAELTLEEAVEINKDGQTRDGVESIKPDGTVVFTKSVRDVTRRVLGYDCAELRPADAAVRAKELKELFDAFVRKSVARK